MPVPLSITIEDFFHVYQKVWAGNDRQTSSSISISYVLKDPGWLSTEPGYIAGRRGRSRSIVCFSDDIMFSSPAGWAELVTASPAMCAE